MNAKKVLIISHNPINTTDNMGKTIGNIFSKFKEEELCQLYFRKQNVEASNCKDFFCIDDVSMVKSIFNRFYKTGQIVQNNTIVNQPKESEEDIFQYGRKRTGKIYILRNILWKIGKWKSKGLKMWLAQMKPTCIFFVAGDYNFAFNISMKISKMLNIPLYIYYTDEFYRKNIGKQDITNKIAKSSYRRIFSKAIKQSKDYFTITENMLEFYQKEFDKKGNVLMNSTNILGKEKVNLKESHSLKIKYIGNLGCDRWKNIIEIKEVIDRVNESANIKFEFEVYSGEKNKEILEKVKKQLGVDYKGSISNEVVQEKIQEADILVHTENFEDINKERVKYSLSTKIPDTLASKRILLAYGPKEVASMEYIEKNNVGIVANNKLELETKLFDLANNKIDINSIMKNATELVEKNHRIKSIHNLLYKIIMEE